MSDGKQVILELKEALEPFTKHYDRWMDDRREDGSLHFDDTAEMHVFARVTYGDLRRARRALNAAFFALIPLAEDSQVSRKFQRRWVVFTKEVLRTCGLRVERRWFCGIRYYKKDSVL